MTQDVFGFRYAFVYRQGHAMELYKEDGLQVEALSSLQVRMLEANRIPRLLPLTIHEEDLQVKLVYALSATRMLSHLLKIEAFSVPQLAKLMYAVVCAIEESHNYMLLESNFVLKENFIYIGRDWSDVYLTYIPLEKQEEAVDVCQTIEKLLSKLIMYLSDENQTHMLSWQQTLYAQNQSIRGLKSALLQLMDESSAKWQQKEEEVGQIEVGLPKSYLKSVDLAHEPQAAQAAQPHSHKIELESSLSSNPSKSMTFTRLNTRTLWYTLALFLVCLALLWQQYVAHPSTSSLQLVTGATLLLGDIVFILLFRGLPTRGEKDSFKQSINQQKQANRIESPHLMGLPTNLAMALPASPAAMNMKQYYADLPNHTTLLRPSQSNATVVLGQSKPQPSGPRLEYICHGMNQSVLIQKELFTIGRKDDQVNVDLPLEEAGVSRIHAEIIRFGVTYQIRDAGSTNGTYLNDEQLVVYQGYPLKDGDCIRILRHEWRFRIADK
ncbi:DUF6382 domain-containing protein [Paenibacillus roseipurpureus]|uniref:DUF6382 domain-containing protein n=1 Tax=Paenibacillus roseopurpureus TaxID=2918901 RepID=A0AA96LJQ7_9BACL|nr:DUF6382 domain-containing protein [Paenibacillus sp. MBLB1832]WNR42248.1 DUF6382 domain-containing protein [Paenibacillus sp. MBLB1832]